MNQQLPDFFTADTHFGHHNIIKYTERYKLVQTVDEMDTMLIERWNSKVSKDDTIIHVGDVAFNNFERLSELNGHKKLIKGNHDLKQLKNLAPYFEILSEPIALIKEEKIVLCHYPMYSWPNKARGWIHLHGHCHGTVDGYDKEAIDVGVDCWDYYPVTLEETRNRIKERCT